MKLIYPNWQVAERVQAFTTTRQGGVSVAPFDSLNVGDHVGDQASAVLKNRELVVQHGKLPHFPLFLQQIHSTKVASIPTRESHCIADAVYTNQANQVCAVMTADCLPVLFASRQGNEVAATHAGWRGLCDGILENTVARFSASPDELQVWLGPAIGPQAFEVGEEVLAQFVAFDSAAQHAFQPILTTDTTQGAKCGEKKKYFADIYALARQRLHKLGITQIYGGEYCTFSQSELFFSYRRDKQTGRMVSLIWFSE